MGKIRIQGNKKKGKVTLQRLAQKMPEHGELINESFAYYRAAVGASAIATISGVFGLVLAFLLIFKQGGITSDPVVLGAAIALATLSLAVKATLIPTRGRLENHLLSITEWSGIITQ